MKIIDSLKKFFSKNMSLDEVAEKYSPEIDALIEKKQGEGLTFSAGKFKIARVDDENFSVGFEIYFKDAAEKWVKVADVSKPLNAEILLSPEAWLELKSANEKIFDIDAPQKECAL